MAKGNKNYESLVMDEEGRGRSSTMGCMWLLISIPLGLYGALFFLAGTSVLQYLPIFILYIVMVGGIGAVFCSTKDRCPKCSKPRAMIVVDEQTETISEERDIDWDVTMVYDLTIYEQCKFCSHNRTINERKKSVIRGPR